MVSPRTCELELNAVAFLLILWSAKLTYDSQDQAEKDRMAAELEEEKRKNELLEKELAEKKEEEEKARRAQEDAELAKAEAEVIYSEI